MRLGRERPRKLEIVGGDTDDDYASMRLGRERPRKDRKIVEIDHRLDSFNEAGARTPQKGPPPPSTASKRPAKLQ